MLTLDIFIPLFEAEINPEKYPALTQALKFFGGFTNSIFKGKETFLENYPGPQEWNMPNNPPEFYYHYYFWANLYQLNGIRIAKNKSFSISFI